MQKSVSDYKAEEAQKVEDAARANDARHSEFLGDEVYKKWKMDKDAGRTNDTLKDWWEKQDDLTHKFYSTKRGTPPMFNMNRIPSEHYDGTTSPTSPKEFINKDYGTYDWSK